jgi:hypothetical protein
MLVGAAETLVETFYRRISEAGSRADLVNHKDTVGRTAIFPGGMFALTSGEASNDKKGRGNSLKRPKRPFTQW